MVLTVAGAAWSLVALVFRPGSGALQLAAVICPALILVGFIIRRLAIIARIQKAEPAASERRESARRGRRMGLTFAIVVAVEGALIAGAAAALAQANRPLLIPVAVVAIVGAHFVPLAKLFRIPTYMVTGLALVGLAVVSLLIPSDTRRVFLLSISATAVLWASAIAVVAIHVNAGLTEDTA